MKLSDFKTWEEAEVWYARHGYGLEQIRLLKLEWDGNGSKPTEKEAAPTTTKPATVSKTKSV